MIIIKANGFINFKKDSRASGNNLVMGVLGMLITIAFAVVIFFAIMDAGADVIDENDTDATSAFDKVKSMGITVIGLLIIVPLATVAIVIMGIFYMKNRG